MLRIPRDVACKLGFYVYLYIDPRTDAPFYIGKGVKNRVLSHLAENGETRKSQVISQLRRVGMKPRLEILAHRLPDEETALRIEAAAIDLLGLGALTNRCRGWRSVQLGRMSLSELQSYYAARPIKISDPAILIRINKLYRHGMSAAEMYEATRGVWKIGPRRLNAKLALAVFEGVVREVYEIKQWHLAGTTKYRTRPVKEVQRPGRWEFTGRKAPKVLRSRYVGGRVEQYFSRGAQSPLRYVNVVKAKSYVQQTAG